MERTTNSIEMLGLLVQPGFCVSGGKVTKVNPAAAALLIEEGEEIAPRLLTGKDEYAAFSGGSLYLTLDVSGQPCGCCVTRMNEIDIFLIDQEADQAELQAMALAARELREPLANVMITANRLFPVAGLSDDPQTQDQISRLNRGLYQMLRVISNMSDAGRLSAGRASASETVNITQLMDEILVKARDAVSQLGITLHYEGPEMPIFTLADSQLLERAVLNILSNAVKFTAQGGSIRVSFSRTGNRMRLTVQDDGQGISQDLLGSIFHRYLRQPALEDSRYGIGLGMVLIRAAAASHGGTVLIDQPEGAGARITLTLAIRQSSDSMVRSKLLRIDYAGERDHTLLELSGSLPAHLYDVKD